MRRSRAQEVKKKTQHTPGEDRDIFSYNIFISSVVVHISSSIVSQSQIHLRLCTVIVVVICAQYFFNFILVKKKQILL